jgi:hypothetical protein
MAHPPSRRSPPRRQNVGHVKLQPAWLAELERLAEAERQAHERAGDCKAMLRDLAAALRAAGLNIALAADIVERSGRR